MPISAVPDHVAVAVSDRVAAEVRWVDQLGGRPTSWYRNPSFRSNQYRYRGGAKLELLSPSAGDPSPGNFVRHYLARFGPQIHHVTLKVPDLEVAIAQLAEAGFDAVDVNLSDEHWKESFLRPSQIGGLVVQVAWAAHTDVEWAEKRGLSPEEPPADGGQLVGLHLRHPDLDRARFVWSTLGASVDEIGGELVCRWGDAPLSVAISRGERAGPVALRFRGLTAGLPHDDVSGAAVEAVR